MGKKRKSKRDPRDRTFRSCLWDQFVLQSLNKLSYFSTGSAHTDNMQKSQDNAADSVGLMNQVTGSAFLLYLTAIHVMITPTSYAEVDAAYEGK